MIIPVIISNNQFYIVRYSDDIIWIDWARTHGTSIIDIITAKLGTGFRPMMNFWYALSYNLWGAEPKYYYILNGILFSGSMVFLYLIGKTLYNKNAGLISVLLYLAIDSSFILISKINFLSTTGELFFLTSSLFFSINYFRTQNCTSKWLAILFSVLAFLSKEPSLIIIPLVNLFYLWSNNQLKPKYILLNGVPLLYMLSLYLFLSPEIGIGTGNVLFRFINNIQTYADIEINVQLKPAILLFLSIFLSGYYIYKKQQYKELSLCLIWSIVAIAPFLITQQKVQLTYLAEMNMGVVLLIGIIISKGFKENNLFIKTMLIIAILTQITYIPTQIENMRNYNMAASDDQKVFFNTVNSLHNIPTNTIFYLSDDQRPINSQISSEVFQQYLCLRDLCNIKVVTNMSESQYIILPSSLDVLYFNKLHPNITLEQLYQFNSHRNVGYILKQ